MAKAEAKLLLKGFNFNINAVLGAVLYKPFQVDAETGEISIAELSPAKDVSIPEGATHVIFKSGLAVINFVTSDSAIAVSEPVKLAINADAQALSVKPAAASELEGTRFILLAIDFVQVVNNVDYSLNNNSYNVLAIVEVI